VSPQKLNLVAQLIRGKKVATALADLSFRASGSRRREEVLESAIANAENNHDLDVDALVVAEAMSARPGDEALRPRGRGRAGPHREAVRNLTIVVAKAEASRGDA
jgi:large subunit ribosomal protein L22